MQHLLSFYFESKYEFYPQETLEICEENIAGLLKYRRISCDALFTFSCVTPRFFGGKNRSHQWENLENIFLKQIAKLLKKKNHFSCYFIALSKK